MGRGSYTAADWNALRQSKKLSEASQVEVLYSAKHVPTDLISANVPIREARDCEDSPESTPIVIGFDTTSSMGYLAKELALHTLNDTVLLLQQLKPVTNPQILCAAIGDAKCDLTPLQVTQFESDIRIIEQLCRLYLEGGGGNNGGESYHLLWYFAAFHTRTDCLQKRKKKGYLFTIGEDVCHPILTSYEIKRCFQDQVAYHLSNEELLRAVKEAYHVFHIHIETPGLDNGSIFQQWSDLLPGNCTILHKKDISLLSELIAAIFQISTGMSANQALRSMHQENAERLARSVSYIRPQTAPTKNITF